MRSEVTLRIYFLDMAAVLQLGWIVTNSFLLRCFLVYLNGIWLGGVNAAFAFNTMTTANFRGQRPFGQWGGVYI